MILIQSSLCLNSDSFSPKAISNGSASFNCDDFYDDLAIMMVLMFVIDEDIDDDNSRGDDDGVNTSEAKIGPGGVETTHAMLLMVSSYTWTVRNMIMLKCCWVLLEMMSLKI